jgi:O-methyltransferase involved in polyketide biosynthesis
MNTENSDSLESRNFTTISPSAKSLLFLKGYTNIPFAQKTAELVSYPKQYTPDYEKKDLTFWARLLHFENRYWSIDQLLEGTGCKNILELSSGYSFRGLATAKSDEVYYIDTDLPELIKTKLPRLEKLAKDDTGLLGTLELLPLNALDEESFLSIVDRFPDGPVAIINEGLLMYLDVEEKTRLCNIIHRVLKQRGGYWITADIYIKQLLEKLNLTIDQGTKEFFAQHDIEKNKFESFEEAEAFFNHVNFAVDAKASVGPEKLSALEYFLKNLPAEQMANFQRSGKIQETWRLRIA